MLNLSGMVIDLDIWEVCATLRAEEQRITLGSNFVRSQRQGVPSPILDSCFQPVQRRSLGDNST